MENMMLICRSYVRSGITAVLMALVAGGAITRAYVSNGHTWGVRQVPYYVNPANNDVSQASAVAAIQAGAATWGSQSNAAFSFYYMGATNGTTVANNGKNEMFFRNDANGGVIATTYWWYDGTGHLVDADILFYDGGWTFYTGTSGCVDGVYIEDVAAHEFGHALGLGHSSVTTATMYPSITRCATDFRTLDADDIAGVEALYPSTGSTTNTANTAPSVSISSPANNASFVDGTAVTFSGSASDQQDGNLTAQITWTSSALGQLGVGGSVVAVLPVGTNVVTASVTDRGGLTTTKQITVTVTAVVTTSTTPPASSLALSASGYKVKGMQRASLSWQGATSTYVDVYRNGSRVMTVANSGSATDAINKKGSGSYTYQLCEAGTSTCSNTTQVNF
jgi:hypothetical protein